MADHGKTTNWGCSDSIWFLVLTFNFGFFVGIPVLGWLLAQDPDKMHWGLKLLGIPFGLILAWLTIWALSKSEVLATPVVGIVLTIFFIIKGLHVWLIIAGTTFLAGAVVCLVMSRRTMNEAAGAEFIGRASLNQMSWLDPTESDNPFEQFSRLQQEAGSLTSKTEKLRKHAALYGFNGLAGLVIGLNMLGIGIIKLL